MPASPVLVKHSPLTTSWVLGASDEGVRVKVPAKSTVMTIHMYGSFGGTVSLLGSMDDSEYHTLSDVNGDPVGLTQEGIVTVTHLPNFIKPSSGVGVSGTTVVVNFR